MINRVVLVGRLTRDVELRYTTSGAAVGTFALAVNRDFTNANGERETDFINAVIWRKSAENFANFTSKGSLVAVEGRLQTRNYENQQGTRVYVTEVVVDNFTLLETRAESEARRSSAGANNNNNFGGNTGSFSAAPTQNPFGEANATSNGNVFGGAQAATPTNNDPFAGQGQEVNLSDDDLPF
ncbi:MAG: single-stranded DNA-binding protein [Lactobacillaceae bacterium]|jgi:single-strand DNA-binding protein|nr:single-stranded DNA-binding protein [Lactobacillaceae bacterium]